LQRLLTNWFCVIYLRPIESVNERRAFYDEAHEAEKPFKKRTEEKVWVEERETPVAGN
jgi:hypothetical protein